jgi:hypothetical protein
MQQVLTRTDLHERGGPARGAVEHPTLRAMAGGRGGGVTGTEWGTGEVKSPQNASATHLGIAIAYLSAVRREPTGGAALRASDRCGRCYCRG